MSPNDHEIMTVIATCGHPVTFRVNPEKSMAARIAKHRDRKCGPCRISEHEASLAKGMLGVNAIKGSHAPRHLPSGTVICLNLDDSKIWRGTLFAEDIEVSAQGTGLIGMTSKLAKLWLMKKGFKVKK